jgi:UDP-glucose 4-epimerase
MSNNPQQTSVFGARGFILSRFAQLYPEISFVEPRESNNPKYNTIIYGIGSNTNYNIFENDLTIDINSNLIKLAKVLENCRTREINVIFLSSWFVYAGSGKVQNKEDDIGNPLGWYSIFKKAAESMLMTFCHVYPNVKFKILRLANVYGPGDEDCSSKKNAMQFLANKVKNGENINLYNGGNIIRDFILLMTFARPFIIF